MSYFEDNATPKLEDILLRIQHELDTYTKNIDNDNVDIDKKIARFKGLVWDAMDVINELRYQFTFSDAWTRSYNNITSRALTPLQTIESNPTFLPMAVGYFHDEARRLLDMATPRRSLLVNQGYATFPSNTMVESTSAEIALDFITGVIRNIVNSQERKMNILFQRYEMNYHVLQQIQDVKDKIRAYAFFADSFRINRQNRELLEKVAIGEDKMLMSSRDCFDIVVSRTLVSDFQIIKYDGKVVPSREENMITRAFGYLRENGVLILTIPSWRLDRKVCTLIAKSFNILYNGLVENDQMSTMVFVLQKSSTISKEQSNSTFIDLRRMFHVNGYKPSQLVDADAATILPPNFPANEGRKVSLFKGTEPDIMAMEIMLSKSSAYQIKKAEYDVQLNPTLPVTKGQLGLLIASGKMDGIVDEGNGTKHIIRGAIIKKRIRKLDFEHAKAGEPYDTVTSKIRSDNEVVINVIAGDGSYQQIAMIS